MVLGMILQTSAQETAWMEPAQENENKRLMEAAIQESMKENPNPDLMSYEQLSELGDQIGTVSKGFSPDQLLKLKPKSNYDYLEDCAICIDKMEIENIIKVLN